MQLNIYVPKGKEKLIEQIERLARKKDRSKNEVVLLALEQYLHVQLQETPSFATFDLGVKGTLDRPTLYQGQMARKVRDDG